MKQEMPDNMEGGGMIRFVATFKVVIEAETISDVDDDAMGDVLISLPGVVEVTGCGVQEISERQPQWCPVCKIYHVEVGEATDAGLITRACPNLPTSDPRYYGSPVYTGDRG